LGTKLGTKFGCEELFVIKDASHENKGIGLQVSTFKDGVCENMHALAFLPKRPNLKLYPAAAIIRLFHN
jgi:hypothetical protein